MKVKLLPKIFVFFLAFSLFHFGAQVTSADPICSSIEDCQQKKAEKENQVKSISAQINQITIDIQITEYRIQGIKEQIKDLTLDIDTTTKKITNIEKSLDGLTKVLINRVVATYQVGSAPSLQALLISNDISDFVRRANYLRIAQAHDKRLIYDTVQAKNDYSNQKDIFEGKKEKVEDLQAQLEVYTNQLAQEKALQQQLLSTTQSQLSQINAQITALSNFARSRVGPSGQIIPHQDLSDGWGRYYNQRDASWGNNLIGLSSEQVWAVGCLLTSYAMVTSHYGGSISPADVAANSGNFWGNTALFLRPGPAANGHSATAVSNPSLDSLRNELNSGNMVIAGLSYDGGPIADHWLVLRSVDGDTFRINDPLYAGAMNVLLTDHYSGLTIVEARIYR